MKKIILTILLFSLVLASLILAQCTFLGKEKAKEVPAGITESSPEAETYISCLDRCASCETNCEDSLYYTKALADENKNVCERITSTTLQQECTEQLLAVEAVAELNKEKCVSLSDEGGQQTCLTRVASEIAIQSSSIEKCSEAPDTKRCEALFSREMAVLTGDASYCAPLEEEQKQLCLEAKQTTAATTE